MELFSAASKEAPEKETFTKGFWLSDSILEMCLLLQIMTVESSRVAAADTKSAAPVPDLTQLSYLNEPCILHNMQERFNQGRIYTAAGPVLIAINPFTSVSHMLPLQSHSSLRDCGKVSQQASAQYEFKINHEAQSGFK